MTVIVQVEAMRDSSNGVLAKLMLSKSLHAGLSF